MPLPSRKSITSTYRTALALLGLWLLLTVADVWLGLPPTYGLLFWISLMLCFVWIFVILQRDAQNRGSEAASLFLRILIAAVLTVAYGYVDLVVTVNFAFLIGGHL